MKKLILILLAFLLVSCALDDIEDIKIHDRERDRWEWIEFQDNEAFIETFGEGKNDSSRYCPLFNRFSCMIVRDDGWFYIEIDVSKHDYDKMRRHFKKHIALFERGFNSYSHHDEMNCEVDFNCSKQHLFW